MTAAVRHVPPMPWTSTPLLMTFASAFVAVEAAALPATIWEPAAG